MMDHFKNFGMMIPNDILRFSSGTAVIPVSQQDKNYFIECCEINMPEIKELSIEEIQGVFKYWKQIK